MAELDEGQDADERRYARGWSGQRWAAAHDAQLLEVRDLAVEYHDPPGVRALVDVEFSLSQGRRLGLIGASGAGKTSLLKAVMGLLPPSASVTGSVRVGGAEVVGAPEVRLRPLRGSQMAIVFEHPGRALDPTMRVDRQVGESLRAHLRRGRALVRRDVLDLFERVELAPGIGRRFPHELTEAERQRVLLAGAVAARPALLLVDETAAAIPSATRRSFFALLDGLQRELGFALVLVAHETAPLFAVCDEIIVLSAGRILEQATPSALTTSPRVPYSAALVAAGRLPPQSAAAPDGATATRPSLRARLVPGPLGILRGLPGRPVRPHDALAAQREVPARGCAHAATCPQAIARCHEAAPPLKEYEYGHRWACWNPLAR